VLRREFGEHARLGRGRTRLGFRALPMKVRFGPTPKPTPETGVLPEFLARAWENTASPRVRCAKSCRGL
jgi:hypothetical protein